MSLIDVPPDAVIDAIEDGTARITRRLEIYEADGVTLWNPEGMATEDIPARLMRGGTVSLDANRDERRLLDVTLDNGDGLLHPDPYNGFWYDKVLRPYRGVELLDGTYWECQLGDFLIDSIDYDDFPPVVQVKGRDFTKKMIGSKFEKSKSFDAAYKLGDLVTSLAENSGITADRIDIPANTPPLGKRYDVERGVSRWEACKKACDSKDYQLYFNNKGVLVMRKYADPALDAVQFTFKTGSDGNITSYSRGVADTELYNHVIVISDASDNEIPFFGEVKNTEPSSPTRIDRIGDRLAPILTYATIESNKQATATALSYMKRAALEPYNFKFGSITYPWIEVGVVAKITDPKALPHDPDKFLLDTASIPLGPGAMDGTAKRVTIVRDVNSEVV